MVHGELYSSYLNIHSLGDHFIPTLGILAPFYVLSPSIHWILGAKLLAYIACLWLFYRIAQEIYPSSRYALRISVIVSMLWLFFYSPAIKGLQFEFQVSSLAPPFVLYFFLSYLRKNWFQCAFAILMVLGCKEHLGSVFIGFGAYFFLQRKYVLGIALSLLGIASIALIMFVIPSLLLEDTSILNADRAIAPWQDISAKFLYLLKLYWPLGFIPLFFWKQGILALPVIGINLIAGKAQLYSANFHYDDVPSTLLFLGLMLAIKEINWNSIKEHFQKSRILQGVVLIWLMGTIMLFPYSNLRYLKRAIPTSEHWAIVEEIQKFNQIPKEKRVAMQGGFGNHVLRKHIQFFITHRNQSCVTHNSRIQEYKEIDYILLSPSLSRYQVNHLEECIQLLQDSPQYQQLEEYQHLIVFKKQ